MKARGNKLFIGVESVRGFFLYDVAPVHEIEHPFRHCGRALFLHVFPGKALVIGKWHNKKTSLDEHLIEALRGRTVDFQEERYRFHRRETVQESPEESILERDLRTD